jgi:phosphoglycerate dehydrogenase-like enzyme
MLRVGYPEQLTYALPKEIPAGIVLIPLADTLTGEIALDVLIGDPFPSRTILKWSHLRGVKLFLALLAGTEWAPPLVGPSVTICNARGAHTIPTAEWVITAILSMLKYIPLHIEVQKSGKWKRRFEAAPHYANLHNDHRELLPPVMQEELTNKSVLLIGYGSIGQQIESFLAPFNVSLTRVARTARTSDGQTIHAITELDALIPSAEIIILILPATDETHHLFDARRLALMQQGALIVNAARGTIINTDALVAALTACRIRAALDVTDPEPLPESHPLWNCPNTLITAHIGGSSPNFAIRSMAVAFDELRRYINGEPLQNIVQQGK